MAYDAQVFALVMSASKDKSQVEFIFKMIHEAREKALEGMSELGYTPCNSIHVEQED